MEREYIGSGVFERFLAHFRKSGLKRLFVVASRSTLARQRSNLGLLAGFIESGEVFSDFEPNPAFESIQSARARCRLFGPDAFLALGGGSAIDVAKAVKYEFPEPAIPLVAIPTTAGSGSEATHFAVYYRGDEKVSLAHPRLVPDVAVVDPVFSRDMPPPLAAATGFDALAQAVEALWALGATDAGREFATRAVRLLLPNIARAVKLPDDVAGAAMALGANLAGKAINLCKTTAPHALSYFLTKRHGIPHGHAAALFMPCFFIENTMATAWLGVICYSFQIFFDFSGYSDMAIGLGKMFGFDFLENFNYPYISKSITEFWRRWHISLSTWFRDYIYIPLGGNRTGNTYVNLLIVFVITGFWHGASFNFLIWGLWHGVFLIVERLQNQESSSAVRHPVRYFMTMLIVAIGWVFFRADGLGEALTYLGVMFSVIHPENVGFTVFYYVNTRLIVVLIIAIVGSFPVFDMNIVKSTLVRPIFKNVSGIAILMLFSISIIFVVSSSYNPFIYFRF